jgi:peptidoglycan/LPS O-acetylase OafA/YrhL
MERKRFDEVDVIRAFGIIGVIIIHILTYNLTGPINNFLWNYLQFVVVAFIFCSGFVLYSIYQNSFTSVSRTILWYKKRIVRLLVPFWIYLVAHFAFSFFFPNYFSGLGLSMNLKYFINSALLIGGTNLNWLPLIFLLLTFLFPVFTNWINKSKIILAYVLGSVFITAIFSFAAFPYSLYRFVMWIPWSLVLLFAIYISKKVNLDKSSFDTNKRYLFFGISFFVIFLIFYILNLDLGRSLNFYDHKYPPDFFYLAFGISFTCFALLIARFKIWQTALIKKAYFFISNNSYQIFFIHYIMLDAVLVLSKKNMLFVNPFIAFLIIFLGSLSIAFVFNKVQLNFKKR